MRWTRKLRGKKKRGLKPALRAQQMSPENWRKVDTFRYFNLKPRCIIVSRNLSLPPK